MILQRLKEYAEQEGLLGQDFSMETAVVQWVATVDADGRLVGIVPLEVDETRQGGGGKAVRASRRGVRKPAPVKIGSPSGSAGAGTFLCDSLDRYLLWDWFPEVGTVGEEKRKWVERALEKKNREKLRRDHDYLVDLHREGAQKCQDKGLLAVERFLESLSEGSVIEQVVDELFRGNARPWSDKVAFSLYEDQGRLAQERPLVQENWREKYWEGTADDRSPHKMPCLCCGDVTWGCRLHRAIKGIPGGDAKLISFDDDAFRSYGFRQSLNASVCEKCMVGYTRALNHLLRDEASCYTLGPTTVATFWSVGKGDTNPMELLSEADPQAVKDLLSSVRVGERKGVRTIRYGDTDAFHTLVLGRTKSRAIVLDYLELPLERVRAHLAAWFEDLAVDDGAEIRYPGLWQLKTGLAATASGGAARRLLDRWEGDLSPQVGPKLLRAAMNGTPLAFDLFASAVRRNHTDPPVSPRSQRHSARASLLKLYFNRTSPGKEEKPMTPGLDRHRTEPAYRCGRLLSKLDEIQDGARKSRTGASTEMRLLSKLDEIQDGAIPGAKSGAVEKAYAAASTAPALVFPGLLRTARHHLAKLERDKPGYKVRLEQDLQEVLEELSDFPRTLDLRNQGLFSLGFYHQQAERYRGKSQDEPDEE